MKTKNSQTQELDEMLKFRNTRKEIVSRAKEIIKEIHSQLGGESSNTSQNYSEKNSNLFNTPADTTTKTPQTTEEKLKEGIETIEKSAEGKLKEPFKSALINLMRECFQAGKKEAIEDEIKFLEQFRSDIDNIPDIVNLRQDTPTASFFHSQGYNKYMKELKQRIQNLKSEVGKNDILPYPKG